MPCCLAERPSSVPIQTASGYTPEYSTALPQIPRYPILTLLTLAAPSPSDAELLVGRLQQRDSATVQRAHYHHECSQVACFMFKCASSCSAAAHAFRSAVVITAYAISALAGCMTLLRSRQRAAALPAANAKSWSFMSWFSG